MEEIARTSPTWTIRDAVTAGKELTAIAASDPDHVVTLTGPGATESALVERLPAADVVHLAAPFRVNGASPLFSPMLLARDPATDGTLEAREVMNLDLRADVAVLSDGGAMSMRDAADEVGMIAWAWRAAGVRNLVLPRWSTGRARIRRVSESCSRPAARRRCRRCRRASGTGHRAFHQSHRRSVLLGSVDGRRLPLNSSHGEHRQHEATDEHGQHGSHGKHEILCLGLI